MLRSTLALSLALLAPSLTAGDLVLDMPTDVGLGDVYQTCLTSPYDAYSLLMLSDGDGPTPTKFGVLSIDVPFFFSVFIPLQGGVPFCFDHLIHCDPALVDLTLHLQFIAQKVGDPSVRGASNPATITIHDDACISPGDFVTFTMGGWGAPCNGGNAGCIRDAGFATAFPGGMLLGDQDGIDGDNAYAMLFTTSAAVEAFLPSGGSSGVLSSDLVNPTGKPAGNFGGQLGAAMLALAFDDAGLLDVYKNTSVHLGDLTFASGCVAAGLAGHSVRDVVAAANDLISGAFGATIDLGDGAVSVTDMAAALDVLNNNFDNGNQDLGCLELP